MANQGTQARKAWQTPKLEELSVRATESGPPVFPTERLVPIGPMTLQEQGPVAS